MRKQRIPSIMSRFKHNKGTELERTKNENISPFMRKFIHISAMYKIKELIMSSVNKRSFLELLKKTILHVQELRTRK